MTRARLGTLLIVCLWCVVRAHAGVTLFLMESVSADGSFAGTGHVAVYVTRVCAASPVALKRCAPGELGAVLNRYKNLAGYDWVAIPLIPYLYAVDQPENVPLYAEASFVANLRDQYRRDHLQSIAPDGVDGKAPSRAWVQLSGAAYIRKIYAFEIETSEQQDDELIRRYNSRPNRTQFHLVTNNCADFARELINFYYPKALHRNVIADLGVTTPKQMAKCLERYSKRHPELRFSKFVIPQAPGNIRRSRPVRGVVEALFKAKKYMVPLFVFKPLVAGSLGLAYLIMGRFNPAKDAMVFDPTRDLEAMLAGRSAGRTTSN